MKLSDYARKLGIHYRTAWEMFKRNDIPNAYQLPSGTIIVPDKLEESAIPNQIVIYSRVSSSENKDNLEKQAERLENYASAKGYKIYKTIKEIGSGLNDKRQKLQQILEDDNWNILIVEHKDRLTRFGFNYLDLLLKKQGKTIEVINESKEEKEDLMDDFVSVITSFCARLYGQRRNKRKTEKLIQELKNDPD